MFFKKKLKVLPQPKGPYVPGCIDVMLEYTPTGIFARLYYPTNEKHNEVDPSKWIDWVPHENYFTGTAKAILMLPILGRLLFWYASTFLSPVLYGGKIKKDTKLPCIVFSHGYAANRLLYSIIGTELASRGYLVAIIEHRDLSAGSTYYYVNKEAVIADDKTFIKPKLVEFDENFYNVRNEQVQYRGKECSKLLDLLIDLNNGKIPHNVLKDLGNEKDFNFNWEDFKGLLDMSTLTMAGHSFGGGTALYTLSIRKEFKQGLLLDPWMFPVKYDKTVIENITQPLIFINSETFHTSDSVKEMSNYLNNDKREMYTLLHTTHEIQADVGFVTGFWMNPLKKKLTPIQAVDINNALILSFLKKYTGINTNLEDCDICLKKESKNITSGLTKPWTIVTKKV